jgi:hypothetical protein
VDRQFPLDRVRIREVGQLALGVKAADRAEQAKPGDSELSGRMFFHDSIFRCQVRSVQSGSNFDIITAFI